MQNVKINILSSVDDIKDKVLFVSRMVGCPIVMTKYVTLSIKYKIKSEVSAHIILVPYPTGQVQEDIISFTKSVIYLGEKMINMFKLRSKLDISKLPNNDVETISTYLRNMGINCVFDKDDIQISDITALMESYINDVYVLAAILVATKSHYEPEILTKIMKDIVEEYMGIDEENN